MTTPLTLTRPAKIHCLARFFGVSGCFRSNQSNKGMTTRLRDCGMAQSMGQRPGSYQPGPTAQVIGTHKPYQSAESAAYWPRGGGAPGGPPGGPPRKGERSWL